MKNRTYSELSKLTTFIDRFNYLKLQGSVGESTFGFDRYLNQKFYSSYEWKKAREEVISRDLGCDLGIEGFNISSQILIHHMNPITEKDITDRNNDILNPEFLICTTKRTHNAIHFGDEKLLILGSHERSPGDTKLW